MVVREGNQGFVLKKTGDSSRLKWGNEEDVKYLERVLP